MAGPAGDAALGKDQGGEDPDGTLTPMVAQAWFLVSAALLVVSGIAKMADPVPTMGALRAARLPHRRWTAVALGGLEVAVAGYAIVFGGVAVLGVAALYLAFTVFVVVALRLGLPLSSCGCFGRADTPPTWLHVAYNSVATLAAVAAAGGGWGGVRGVWQTDAVGAIVYLGLAGIGVFASYLLLSELPPLLSLSRSA